MAHSAALAAVAAFPASNALGIPAQATSIGTAAITCAMTLLHKGVAHLSLMVIKSGVIKPKW